MLAFSVTIHSGFAKDAMANTSAKKKRHPDITVNLSMAKADKEKLKESKECAAPAVFRLFFSLFLTLLG